MTHRFPLSTLTPRRSNATHTAGVWLVAAALLASCAKLPERPDVPMGEAPAPAESGVLADTAQAMVAAAGTEDAFMGLPAAKEAMDIRLALIDSAETSLDAQYFVWSGDIAGNLFLRRVMQAADRGVRVRLLVDDLYLLSDSSGKGPDEGLAAIEQHPNIELRVFNPGKYRSGTMGIAGNFMGSFSEFNRRMHNKLFIADGRLAIVGGRNMANEYYGLKSEYNFLDLDALVAGAVVDDMISAFDEYWNAEAAFPATDMAPESATATLEDVRKELDSLVNDGADELAPYTIEPQDWSAYLATLGERTHGGNAVFLQDDPDMNGDEEYRLLDMIAEFDKPQDRESLIVTPYLIPLDGMLDELKEATDAGMRITLLTASLASGDHTAVNAHYKKYRKDILLAGARLFEFHHQPGPELRAMADVDPVKGEFVALHPKVGITDRNSCFVGSLNLDPRALVINKENGLQIESVSFCSELAELIELYIAPENAWEVTLDDKGELQWTSYEGTVHKQPARSGGQRMSDFFFRIMPIEKLL